MQYSLMLLQNIFTEISECQQKQLFIFCFFSAILVIILYLFYQQYQKYNKIQRKKVILIGTSIEEKNKIFNIITENNINRKSNEQDNNQFYEFTIGKNLDLVNSPFSFENDYSKEKKEEIIQKLTLYYIQNVNEILRLYLIVNFETIDQMQIAEILEYFNRFNNIIDIFVTNFQQREDQIQDKENLIKTLSLLVNDQKKIHFIRDDIKIEEFKQLLIQSANLFDYQDSIFHDIDNSEISNLANLFANGKLYQSIQNANDKE